MSCAFLVSIIAATTCGCMQDRKYCSIQKKPSLSLLLSPIHIKNYIPVNYD